MRLGDAAQRSLARSARHYLSELVETSGETANLVALEGDDVGYVFAEAGRHVPSLPEPAGCFGAGRDPGLVATVRRVSHSFALA